MEERPKNWQEARERIAEKRETPIFTPEQITLAKSDYVDSFDRALEVLEDPPEALIQKENRNKGKL